MNRLHSIVWPLFLLWMTTATLFGQRPDNILLVIVDDLGQEQLSAYGLTQTPLRTQNLDALAAQGLRFTDLWSMPVCSPTRATWLTGRYPFRHGVGTALPIGVPYNPLAAEEFTVPEALRQAAEAGAPRYATGAFGKWHVGGGSQSAPNIQGFDHYAGLLAGAFDYYRWPRTENGRTEWVQDYITSRIVDDASAWINSQVQPWFCYVAFTAPHTPFHAPPAALHSETLPANGDPEENPSLYYRAMVEALDTELGRLLQSIPPMERARTTILFLADNGTTGEVIEAPWTAETGKGSLYQGGIQVPFLVVREGLIPAGQVCSRHCDVSDLFPTILDLAGATPFLTALPRPIDGVSLYPYFSNPQTAQRKAFSYSEVFGNPTGENAPRLTALLAEIELITNLIAGAQAVNGRAIRDDRYKLQVLDDAAGTERFFDLTNDPFETVDLLASGTLSLRERTRLLALRTQLAALLASE